MRAYVKETPEIQIEAASFPRIHLQGRSGT